MLFKKVNLFLVLVILLSIVSACAPAAAPTEASGDKPIKIGVSMLFDDLWLTTLRDAMTEYAATQPGVELIMVDSKEDVATQLGQVENFVAQKVDVIVLIAANTDAADPMTKAAQDAGIPLCTLTEFRRICLKAYPMSDLTPLRLELCRRSGLPKN